MNKKLNNQQINVERKPMILPTQKTSGNVNSVTADKIGSGVGTSNSMCRNSNKPSDSINNQICENAEDLLTTSIDEKLWEEVKIFCIENQIKISDWLNEIIKNKLEKKE